MIQYPPLRSQESETRCYIRFMNLTERRVNVVWVNFSGLFVSYTTLDRGQFVDVNTFKTHPWIAFDDKTQDRMHIDKKLVYHPQTFREHLAEKLPGYKYREGVESRIMIVISLPVHSLKYTVLLYLKNHLNDPLKVDQLDLPRLLADSLKDLIEERKNLQKLPLHRMCPNIP
ncbi:protein Vhl [Coccinella septempunctata]|uniref:protein Vhl n=1 Tax=Coccinella septempunctata TaxID=41139 RepID=UPI001D072981|nr:protein Vhl [Coccinella septempunctata]